jgi:hypothetical protein
MGQAGPGRPAGQVAWVIRERAVVLLHPADDRSGRQFLFEHLAQTLPGHGVAVLRYDRRDMPDGRDVPYRLQVEDLTCARARWSARSGRSPSGCGDAANAGVGCS